MEVISSFPLDPPLDLDFNLNKEFAVSFSGLSPASDSFSTPSSSYSTFTPASGCSTPQKSHTLDSSSSYPQSTFAPTSGRSTPLKRHTVDSSYQENSFFNMNQLPAYASGSLSPEYKPNPTRDGYLDVCAPEGVPVKQSVEPIASSMGYPNYMEMSMPQTYSTSAPVDAPTYDMYDMPDRYRARPMGSAVGANTVYMSDICKNEPYDLRPPLSTIAAFQGGDHFRGSDTESVASHSVLSPMGSIPSPELPQQLLMLNMGDRAGGSRYPRASSDGRAGNIDQGLMKSEAGDDGQLVCEVKTASSGKQVCKVPGCSKSFNRKEHLKRHERATHGEERIPCPFCDEKTQKPFNRADNFKHHIKMHAQDRQHGRVNYVPEAVQFYADLVRDTKPRTQRRGVGAARRPGAHRPRRYDTM